MERISLTALLTFLSIPASADSSRRELRLTVSTLVERESGSLDPTLVMAVIEKESTFDPWAVSSAGCKGLMQLDDGTMREVTKTGRPNPFDPVQNVRAGMAYLRRLFKMFGTTEMSLMAYTAGPGNFARYMRRGRIPKSVARYAGRVIDIRNRLCAAVDCSNRQAQETSR